MKRVLLSGVGLVGVVSSLALSAPVYAQKGSVLRPATQWVVNKVDGRAGDYCTMVRRYEYNTLLTVAQNADAESTFALDFQRPILKSGQSLNVTLDPGAGQQRKFSLQPISNQAFVARLGHDPSFFTALKKTGFLRVEVGQQSYSFNLSDIDDGKYKLNSCVTSLPPILRKQQEPVVAEAVPVPQPKMVAPTPQNKVVAKVDEVLTSPPVAKIMPEVRKPVQSAAEMDVLAAQVTRLRGENAALETKNLKLQDELKAVYAEKRDSIAKEVVDTSERERKLEELNQAQVATMQGLEAELSVLRAEKAEQDTQLQALKEARLAYEQERQVFEKRLAEKPGEMSALAAAQEKASALQDENFELRRQLQTAQLDSVPNDEAMKALKAENQSLKAALAESEQLIASLEAEKLSVDIASELAAVEESYRQQLATKEREIEVLMGQNEELEQKLAHANLMSDTMEDALFGEVAEVSQKIEPAASDVTEEPKVSRAPEPIDLIDNRVVSPHPDDISADALNAAQLQEMRVKRNLQDDIPIPAVQEELPVPELRASQSAGPLDGFESVAPEEGLKEEKMVEIVSWNNGEEVVTSSPPVTTGSSGRYEPSFSLSDVLNVPVRLVENVSGPQQLVYQWNVQDLYGSAEQRPLPQAQQFDVLVEDYLERTASRCRGDFAIVPDVNVSEERGDVRVDRYDVACVGSGVNSSAALLFFDKAGTFTVLAHEGPSERLGEAIDKSEQVVNAVISGG